MHSSKYDEINQELTNKARQDPKYNVFLDWLISNGAIIDPSIQYPVAFGPQGYIGVATNREIQSYEAIISIPKSLIIDMKKVLQSQDLRNIFIKYPNLFCQQNQQQNNFNMLTLFLVYEKSKQQKSFYKPYFDAAQCQDLIVHWTKDDLKELQSPNITHQIKRFQKQMKIQSEDFLNIVISNSNIFPITIPTDTYLEYYQWAFEFIMTRGFGWTVPESYLIPFADMLNHGQHSIDHCIVDSSKQMYPNDNSGYKTKLRKCNLSLLGNTKLSEESKKNIEIKRSSPSKRTNYITNHKQFLQDQILDQNQNSKYPLYKIAYSSYKQGNKKFRQLFFDTSSCTEDNDTDGADIMTKQFNKQTIKIDDKQIIKNNKSKSLFKGLTDYWKSYTYKNIMPIVQEGDSGNMTVQISQNSQKSVSQSNQESQQDKYEWINDSDIRNINFILYTTSKYKKGQQIFNFYGKRANKFFVIGYNFALINNKYDSYGFKLYFENHQMKPVSSNIKITSFLTKTQNTKQQTTQIRLKKSKVCIELINHCRAIILSTFTNSQNIYGIPVTIPNSLIIEQKSIQYCKQIVEYKLKSFKTSIQQDQKILNENINPRLLTAVITRLSYKLILNKQIEYLQQCKNTLKRWKKGRLEFELEQMNKIVAIKEYICQLDRSLL